VFNFLIDYYTPYLKEYEYDGQSIISQKPCFDFLSHMKQNGELYISGILNKLYPKPSSYVDAFEELRRSEKVPSSADLISVHGFFPTIEPTKPPGDESYVNLMMIFKVAEMLQHLCRNPQPFVELLEQIVEIVTFWSISAYIFNSAEIPADFNIIAFRNMKRSDTVETLRRTFISNLLNFRWSVLGENITRANDEYKSEIYPVTLLRTAAMVGNRDTIQYLITHGAEFSMNNYAALRVASNDLYPWIIQVANNQHQAATQVGAPENKRAADAYPSETPTSKYAKDDNPTDLDFAELDLNNQRIIDILAERISTMTHQEAHNLFVSGMWSGDDNSVFKQLGEEALRRRTRAVQAVYAALIRINPSFATALSLSSQAEPAF
jgi:hypothetical protein